jgi:protein involved in polysaccharide export with SLBB domain
MKRYTHSLTLAILIASLPPTGVVSQTISQPPLPIILAESGHKPFPSTASTKTSSTIPDLFKLNKADYILGPGDQLKVDLFGQTSLFATSYTVLVDGTISLPFVGV